MEPARASTQPRDTHSLLVPQPFPCLVIGDEKHRDQQIVFDVSKYRYYTKSVPEMCNKSIYACSQGWLVLVDLNSKDCYLWNPISLENIQLTQLPASLVDEEICVLSSPPSDPTCHILIFSKVVNSFWLCQPGNLEFTEQEFEWGDESTLINATVVGKTIYCLTFPNRILFTVEFMGLEVQFTQLTMVKLPWPKPAPPEIVHCREWLIESCGELFLVEQMLYGLFGREVYGFLVLQMDFSEKRWMRMKSIGQRTIFLCGSRGMSCVATESGIKPNSIYYTKPIERLLYVFDLENLSISKFLPCPTVSRNSEINWVMV